MFRNPWEIGTLVDNELHVGCVKAGAKLLQQLSMVVDEIKSAKIQQVSGPESSTRPNLQRNLITFHVRKNKMISDVYLRPLYLRIPPLEAIDLGGCHHVQYCSTCSTYSVNETVQLLATSQHLEMKLRV